jgi:hypothetical protein
LILQLSTKNKVLENQDHAIINQAFPLFRKRLGDKTYYKILSESEFEELKIVGKKYAILHIKATKYPEKLYISDLIKAGNSIECLDDLEYSEILMYCQSNLQKSTQL